MKYIIITPPNVFILLIISPLFLKNECRYPCLNDGEPILLGQNSNEFRCECLTGFFGPFCEYQDTSQSIKEKSLTPTSTSLFSHSTNTITSSQQRGWETTFVNLLICVFFLLLLPSLVIYAIRVLYLLLKRCHSYYNIQHQTTGTATNCSGMVIQQNNNHPTPPPHYWAAMGELRHQNNILCNNQQNSLTWLLPLNNREERRGHLPLNNQQQQRMRRRRRSVSPITEVTVQLPSSMYRGRPIHNTRSAGGPQQLHQSQSLTLAEFHELLLRIQREMQTRQHLEGLEHHQQYQYICAESEQQNALAAPGTTIEQQNYHNNHITSHNLSTLPIEPPPSYNELN